MNDDYSYIYVADSLICCSKVVGQLLYPRATNSLKLSITVVVVLSFATCKLFNYHFRSRTCPKQHVKELAHSPSSIRSTSSSHDVLGRRYTFGISKIFVQAQDHKLGDF